MPLLLLVVAAIFDFRQRQIPDWIPIALLAWAIVTTALGSSRHGWVSLLLGLGAAFSLGVLLFWLGGFGGGDAKLIAALGATLGPGEFAVLLFYVAISGGLMAAVALMRGRRD